MASYLPPTEDLPIFDNQVFTSNDEALTYTEAKKLFLTYPTAQGEETISSLIAGEIDYLSPLSGSFFNIGTNQVSGGTVRIGPTGTSGVSVHVGNIDFVNSTINNATSATLNNLSIADSQTTGVLNIGTGTRTTGGNGGAINIGTGANVTAPIYIGGGGGSTSGSINIGQIGTTFGTSTTNINTSTVGSHPVNIGSLTALTTINGASTLTGLATATTGLKTTSITSDGIMGITSATAMTIGATSGALSISSGSTIGINCTNSSALSLGTSGTASVGIGSSGITTTVNGPSTLSGVATVTTSIASPVYNGPSGNATNMTLGASQSTGNISIGGAQSGTSTTGRISIGVNSTSDVYIGSANSSTSGTNLGTCNINKCQFGTNGTTFREMRYGTVAGGTSSGTITFSPSMISAPIITSQIISSSSTQTFCINIHTVTTTGFSYVKNWIYNNATAGGNPTSESFYWIAISL